MNLNLNLEIQYSLVEKSKGVPKIVHHNSYQRLKIPLKNNTRSLNISIAAAITLSEALKQNYFFQND